MSVNLSRKCEESEEELEGEEANDVLALSRAHVDGGTLGRIELLKGENEYRDHDSHNSRVYEGSVFNDCSVRKIQTLCNETPLETIKKSVIFFPTHRLLLSGCAVWKIPPGRINEELASFHCRIGSIVGDEKMIILDEKKGLFLVSRGRILSSYCILDPSTALSNIMCNSEVLGVLHLEREEPHILCLTKKGEIEIVDYVKGEIVKRFQQLKLQGEGTTKVKLRTEKVEQSYQLLLSKKFPNCFYTNAFSVDCVYKLREPIILLIDYEEGNIVSQNFRKDKEQGKEKLNNMDLGLLYLPYRRSLDLNDDDEEDQLEDDTRTIQPYSRSHPKDDEILISTSARALNFYTPSSSKLGVFESSFGKLGDEENMRYSRIEKKLIDTGCGKCLVVRLSPNSNEFLICCTDNSYKQKDQKEDDNFIAFNIGRLHVMYIIIEETVDLSKVYHSALNHLFTSNLRNNFKYFKSVKIYGDDAKAVEIRDIFLVRKDLLSNTVWVGVLTEDQNTRIVEISYFNNPLKEEVLDKWKRFSAEQLGDPLFQGFQSLFGKNSLNITESTNGRNHNRIQQIESLCSRINKSSIDEAAKVYEKYIGTHGGLENVILEDWKASYRIESNETIIEQALMMKSDWGVGLISILDSDDVKDRSFNQMGLGKYLQRPNVNRVIFLGQIRDTNQFENLGNSSRMANDNQLNGVGILISVNLLGSPGGARHSRSTSSSPGHHRRTSSSRLTSSKNTKKRGNQLSKNRKVKVEILPIFFGTFFKNMTHGQRCKEYDEKGKLVYEGSIYHGLRSGLGKLFEKGRVRYEGSFRGGEKDGKGKERDVINRSSEEFKTEVVVYEGQFKQGKRHGRGEYYDLKSGRVLKGQWEEGVLVEESVKSEYFCPFVGYKFVEKLLKNKCIVGSGAFGIVYKVKTSEIMKHVQGSTSSHLVKKQPFVALKIMKCSTDLSAVMLFRMTRRGISLCHDLKSPHVLEVFGIVRGRREVGYLMEFCPHNMEFIIAQLKDHPVSVKEKLRYLHETSKGIHALHHMSIMHRDLKWANIMLNSEGRIKITDFDTLKEDESEWRWQNENQSSRIGTPGFLAPEVYLGKRYTCKCDVFAFGLMIYSLLWECNNPYLNQHRCSCNILMENIIMSNNLDFHIARCALRPLVAHCMASKFPAWLIDVMYLCWEEDPSKRPDISEIVRLFESQNEKELNNPIILFQFPKTQGLAGVVEKKRMLLNEASYEKIIVWIKRQYPNRQILRIVDPAMNKKITTDEEVLEFIHRMEKPVLTVEFERNDQIEEEEEEEDQEKESEGKEEKNGKVLFKKKLTEVQALKNEVLKLKSLLEKRDETIERLVQEKREREELFKKELLEEKSRVDEIFKDF